MIENLQTDVINISLLTVSEKSVVFQNRYRFISNVFKENGIIGESKEGYDYDMMEYKGDFSTVNGVNIYLSISFFGVEDTLLPINEYIESIQKSNRYKERAKLNGIKGRALVHFKMARVNY